MGTKANVINSIAIIYTKPYSASTTNDPVGTGNTPDWSGWITVGFQSDGSEARIEQDIELFDHEVADEDMAIDATLVKTSSRLFFSSAEGAIAMLKELTSTGTFTAGASPGTNADKLTFGGNLTLAKFSIGFEYTGESGRAAVFFAGHCIQDEGLKLPFKRDGLTTYDVGYKIYKDATADANAKGFSMYQETTS